MHNNTLVIWKKTYWFDCVTGAAAQKQTVVNYQIKITEREVKRKATTLSI